MPIQRQRAVRGVLLLSTQGGDIDAIIASERFALLQVFMVAAAVMIVLSLLLANAIAGPVSRLRKAASACAAASSPARRFPTSPAAADEIRPPLGRACGDMTEALYDRHSRPSRASPPTLRRTA